MLRLSDEGSFGFLLWRQNVSVIFLPAVAKVPDEKQLK